jgi:hypothetical protein
MQLPLLAMTAVVMVCLLFFRRMPTITRTQIRVAGAAFVAGNLIAGRPGPLSVFDYIALTVSGMALVFLLEAAKRRWGTPRLF